MTTLENIRDALPGYARDLQLNLGTVLTPAGAPGLSERQIWAVALAAAAASRNPAFSLRFQALAARHLDAAHVSAAHAAAAIMAMNNVYYRFLHLVEDPEYAKLPARLRMNVIGAPGIATADFELLALAVSAINGCGSCVASHERQLRQHGLAREAVQSAVRIAATGHAGARVLESASGAGAGGELIATVEYSDEPPAARRVLRIGDVAAVDMERLVALRPDVVVAWPAGGNPAQREKIARLHIPVYEQQVVRLVDLPVSVRRLGALAGTAAAAERAAHDIEARLAALKRTYGTGGAGRAPAVLLRSGEHTSAIQSQSNLVCRLLLEKKKTKSLLLTRSTL